jgi:predicted metal-binding membrane protein
MNNNVPLAIMWLAMMLAMMIPAAVPLARAYGATVAVSVGRARGHGSWRWSPGTWQCGRFSPCW